MKTYHIAWLLLCCLVIFGVLSGCSENAQDTEGQPGVSGVFNSTPTQGTVQSGENSSNSEQQDISMQEEKSQEVSGDLWFMQNVIAMFNSIYLTYDYPVFYPVEEATLNRLREMLADINVTFPELEFDIYSIEPCLYGYRVTLNSPVDYQGNPYYVWFEVSTSDTERPRNTIVSAGPDKKLSYKGAGVDYGSVGVGDDLIQFLTYN